MHRRNFAGLCAVLAIGATGCAGKSSSPAAQVATVIRVAAASDLEGVLPEVVEAFQAASKMPVKVEATYGASGQLAQQIKAGAPYDVFLSADEGYVDALARSDDVRSPTVKRYALGTLALVVHGAAAEAVRTLDDLAKPEVKRVAIADPAKAPYGRAAKAALERAGVWDRLGDRIVLAGTVRQALQYVETGNAEAGLVSGAQAGRSGLAVVPIDEAKHDPIVQAGGVTSYTSEPATAEAFLAFVADGPGGEILARHGFRRLTSP